ncbi:MAG: tyrosine-type recombinase/integrase [bacterium]
MASIFLKKGKKTYHYCITYNGKKYQGSTKTTDKASAKIIADGIQTDLAREKNNIPGIYRKIRGVVKFTTLWDKYLASDISSERNIKNKISLSGHFLPVFKNKEIKEITVHDIEKYQIQRKNETMAMPKNQDKRESEISFRVLNHELAILHHFFNYCIKSDAIEKNPAAGIKKLNELERNKALSDEDINKLIAGATNKLTRDIITFLIYTGCRKGEALNLKWDDVDLAMGVIGVKGTKTKNDRYIQISDALNPVLAGIQRNQNSLYVFERNGVKLGDFKRSFQTTCRNAGLKDLRIHDLRHVFASKMVMGGTDLYVVQRLLGHKTAQMTMRYAHLMPEMQRKALNDVFGKFGNFEDMQKGQLKKAMEIIDAEKEIEKRKK